MNNILILGAGASIPFYDPVLSSERLKTVISDRCRWNDLVDRYRRAMNDENVNMVNVPAIMCVLNRINNEHPNYNFEQIIEFIDKICSFNFNPGRDSKIFHDILFYYNAKPQNAADHVWTFVPFLFRQLIAEDVANLHANHKVGGYDDLTQLQTKFISSISNGQSINIFTLNYDEIIWDAIRNLDFVSGFGNEGRFDIKTFLSAKKTISFPHGHSRFSYDDHGILLHADSQKANDSRLGHIGDSDDVQTVCLIDGSYCYSFNTFISTGQQKEPTFDLNPYAAYYQKFASDCLKATKIYIVGYSFSDPHFNRMLLNFLAIARTNRIVIVDRILENICLAYEFMKHESLIQKIFDLFGISRIPMDNSQREDDLNRNGFAEITPQIILYKKGYDVFLYDFNKINL
ncbi:MAG: SIR2 family protein [Chitinophagaceae bacterium]|nr:SIR2 family protein [Chitinophagaceae bacterium]